jgi:endonuclease YncB( thermonuclease family)
MMELIARAMLLLVLTVAPALGSPIEPGAIEVVDGDTIRAGGRTFRLVGFDTPEMGSRSRCESERTLAAAASRRLRQLIAGGGLDLERWRARVGLARRGRQPAIMAGFAPR